MCFLPAGTSPPCYLGLIGALLGGASARFEALPGFLHSSAFMDLRPLLLLWLWRILGGSLTLLASQVLGQHVYTNTWAVLVPDGPQEAERLARKHGFLNMGPVSILASSLERGGWLHPWGGGGRETKWEDPLEFQQSHRVVVPDKVRLPASGVRFSTSLLELDGDSTTGGCFAGRAIMPTLKS